MIPEELAGTYVTEAARFEKAHPELVGLAPCCGWCARRAEPVSIGSETACTLTGEIMAMQAGCNTGGFVYDARPLWEQYPWIPRQKWERDQEGMTVGTMVAIKEHLADGGTLEELPTLRIGGKRWVVPPQARRDKYALPAQAFATDAYGADAATSAEEEVHPLTQQLRAMLAARVSPTTEDAA